jgi:esterase/lipase
MITAAAKEITIPVLVIHDKDDLEVPVKAAQHIYDHLKMVNSY